jgi:hypothetical protein
MASTLKTEMTKALFTVAPNGLDDVVIASPVKSIALRLLMVAPVVGWRLPVP